jgi:hypothetical protein
VTPEETNYEAASKKIKTAATTVGKQFNHAKDATADAVHATAEAVQDAAHATKVGLEAAAHAAKIALEKTEIETARVMHAAAHKLEGKK